MSNNDFKKQLEKAIDHFQSELGKLRTGRANPALVEDLPVDSYGTKTPLKQLASVSVPEPRMIIIQPWDRGTVGDIEKAIQGSDLGLNPANEGDKIRISLPQLTKESREELVKVVRERSEQAKIAVRNLREEAIEKAVTLGGGEDAVEGEKKKIQEKVDETNEKIEKMAKEKETEVMTV